MRPAKGTQLTSDFFSPLPSTIPLRLRAFAPLRETLRLLRENFSRKRRNDRRELAGHHCGDGRAESSEQTVPVTIWPWMVPFSAVNGLAQPPSATGHPILDAILDEFSKSRPTPSARHATPDTS
jgi:hypothetical protein